MKIDIETQVEDFLRRQYGSRPDGAEMSEQDLDRMVREKTAVVAPIIEDRRQEGDESPVDSTEVWQANMVALKQNLEQKIAPLDFDPDKVEPGTPMAEAAAIVTSVRNMTETLQRLSELDPETDRAQIEEIIKNSPMQDLQAGLSEDGDGA